MTEVRSVVVRLDADVSSYIANMHRAGAVTEAEMGRATKASTAHGKAFGAAAAATKGGALLMAGGLALAVKEAADFNEKMALVQSLSHATPREMRELASAAKSVGTGFGFTATEVADGQAELIKAGVSLKDILGGGLKGTLALAAAGQTDVATATTIAASALTQFNLRGSDVPHVADLLAAGADKALGSVEDLGYGLSQAGTTAHTYGLSIEDTTGTLAEFAQAGLIGERGGTTLKQMFLQLAKPTKQASDLMDQYGLSLYKANGQTKSMPELADNIQRSFKDLTPEARNAALAIIFGSHAIQGANILLKDGEKGNRKWIKSVDDQGFAADQARGKLDSLKGDLRKLRATAENGLISLGQGAQNPLRDFVQDSTDQISKLVKNHDLERWGKRIGTGLSTALRDAKPIAVEVGSALKTVGGGIHTLADQFNRLPDGLKQTLVTGAVAGYGAKKLGLGGLVSGGVKTVAGSALGGRGVTPVFVTNMGVGGGLGGVAGKAGGAAGTAEGALLGAGAGGGAAAGWRSTEGAAKVAKGGIAIAAAAIGLQIVNGITDSINKVGGGKDAFGFEKQKKGPTFGGLLSSGHNPEERRQRCAGREDHNAREDRPRPRLGAWR